jgi:hypothetical protein
MIHSAFQNDCSAASANHDRKWHRPTFAAGEKLLLSPGWAVAYRPNHVRKKLPAIDLETKQWPQPSPG